MGMLSDLHDSDHAVCFLQNVWVLDHTYDSQKKKSHHNVSGIRYHFENVWCIPAGDRYHLGIVCGSQLRQNKQLSSLSSLSPAVRCILMEGLAQTYSSSCSPFILVRYVIICNCLDTQA